MRATRWALAPTGWLWLVCMGAPALAQVPGGDDVFVSASSGAAAPDAEWWRAFDDPGLDAVMAEALQGNGDLLALHAMVTQSQAGAGQVTAALMPVVTFDTAGSIAPTDALGFGFGIPEIPGAEETDETETYLSGSAKFNAAWGVDVFTKSWRTQRASRYDALAAAGDRDAAAVALATRVSSSWFNLVAAQAQLDVVRAQVQTNTQLLEVTQARYEGGDAAALDVLQQRQQLAATRSMLPAAEAGVRVTAQQLSVALGHGDPDRLPPVPSVLPDPPAPAGVGRPADLLDSRPELRAASARMDAARLRRQAAVLDALPTVGLSGSWGWQFIDKDEFDSLETWSVGGSVTVPIFNGGAKVNAVKGARAGETYAERSFEQLAITAVQEVEGALVQEQSAVAQLAAVSDQLAAAELTFDTARDAYIGGTAAYLNLLSALGGLQSAQLSHVQARLAVLDARIQLHDALGATWTSRF